MLWEDTIQYKFNVDTNAAMYVYRHTT